MSIFSKFVKRAVGSVKAFTTSDAANCAIGGCLLLGASDGNLDDDEFKKATDMASINPAFEGHDIDALAGAWEKKIEKSFRSAKRDFFGLCDSLKGDTAACQDVLLGMLETSEASKGTPAEEAAEMAIIDGAADSMGLTAWLAKYK